MRGALIAAIPWVLCGCLESAEPQGFQCERNSDCDTLAGQICDEGICWGDPPEGSEFAALVVPPADRQDLALTEIDRLSIAPDGTIADLEFAETVLVSGVVSMACSPGEDCDSEPVVAQVTVSRAASFEGGPRYARALLTTADPRKSGSTFSLRLPRDGAEYRVTIVTEGGAAPNDALKSEGLAPQAPPMSLTLRADQDHNVQWVLGRPETLKTIRGCIENTVGNGSAYAGMHVTAFGRWTPLSRLSRASAVSIADAEGCFELLVPIDMLDEFDIIAKPGPGMVRPTLRLTGEFVADPLPDTSGSVHEIEPPLVMPNAANPLPFKVPIRGLAGAGSVEPVPGASVTFSTELSVPTEEERQVSVTFVATAVSNGLGEEDPGTATVEIYPGSLETNRDYEVRVVSPPDSEYESVFDATVTVGTGEGASVLESIVLDRRVAVTGRFASFAGDPIAGAPLEVRPSPLIRWTLEASGRPAVVDDLQFPSDITGAEGEFLLWLDRELVGLMALYDLELLPPASAAAPRWTFQTVDLDERDGAAPAGRVNLSVLELPPPSYARGVVRDSAGALVPGAEVRLYQLPSSQEICAQVPDGVSCTPPAFLRGSWESDAAGRFSAVLPKAP